MRYALTKRQLSNQEAVVHDYGDKIWEWLCNRYPDMFTISQAADECPWLQHTAQRTRRDYIRVILLNVKAEHEGRLSPFYQMGRLIVWAEVDEET